MRSASATAASARTPSSRGSSASRNRGRRLSAELRAGRRPPLPGAVRASIGLGTTPADIDRLTGALQELAVAGPRWRYRHVAERDEYEAVSRRPLRPERRFSHVARLA